MKTCPICKSTESHEFLKTYDHFYTSEKFSIIECESCHFMWTFPCPNAHEISRYYNSQNYISHNNKASGLINRAYRIFQNINFFMKYRSIKRNVPRGTWMDYGAGNGRFLEYLKRKNIPVLGYEPDPNARKNSPPGIELKDSKEYSRASENYACITMWHVLEHVHNLDEILEIHYTNLNDDGVLVIALPNRDSHDANKYKSFWAAWDVPRHLWHFNESNITALAESHGFNHKKTSPMLLDAIYVSLLSSKYKNSSRISALFTGLASNLIALLTKRPYSSQIYVFKKIRK